MPLYVDVVRRHRARPRSSSALLAATLLVGLSACGSDEESSTGIASGTATVARADAASASEVSSGLAATVATLTSFAGSPSAATSDEVADLLATWESYEGTVEQVDPQAHLALGDALRRFTAAVEAGDQAGMQSALGAFSTASSEYLTAHPG